MTRTAGHGIRHYVAATAITCTLLVVFDQVAAGERLSANGNAVAERGSSLEMQPAAGSMQDSAAVAAVIDRFHRALAAGDSATVEDLLLPDVVVLESGGIESRQEYFAHHLPADIAFARAVRPERGLMAVTVAGDVAWAASTSTSRGTFRDRAVNSAGAELIILRRTADGWKIAAVHWSSRQLRS